MSKQHWTEVSVEDYLFSIRDDFFFQIENRQETSGLNCKELADRIGISKGRMSQILNGRGNITLELMIKCVRALGMKLTIVAYDDGDANNNRGPVHPEMFRISWEKSGRPRDAWSLMRLHNFNVSLLDTAITTDICPKQRAHQPINIEGVTLDYARTAPIHVQLSGSSQGTGAIS